MRDADVAGSSFIHYTAVLPPRVSFLKTNKMDTHGYTSSWMSKKRVSYFAFYSRKPRPKNKMTETDFIQE